MGKKKPQKKAPAKPAEAPKEEPKPAPEEEKKVEAPAPVEEKKAEVPAPKKEEPKKAAPVEDDDDLDDFMDIAGSFAAKAAEPEKEVKAEH